MVIFEWDLRVGVELDPQDAGDWWDTSRRRKSPQRSNAPALSGADEHHVVFLAVMFESSELGRRFRTLRRCFIGSAGADGDKTHAVDRRRGRLHAFGRFSRQNARKRLDSPPNACDLVAARAGAG
ncbi:MAG: hypothetical protein JO262_14025 [Solirubrobacterales bacterium]|nr:hypothetical protein [Solirubrobacterales bacterium]